MSNLEEELAAAIVKKNVKTFGIPIFHDRESGTIEPRVTQVPCEAEFREHIFSIVGEVVEPPPQPVKKKKNFLRVVQ